MRRNGAGPDPLGGAEFSHRHPGHEGQETEGHEALQAGDHPRDASSGREVPRVEQPLTKTPAFGCRRVPGAGVKIPRRPAGRAPLRFCSYFLPLISKDLP